VFALAHYLQLAITVPRMDIFGAVGNALYCTEKLVQYIRDARSADDEQSQLLSELSSLESLLSRIKTRGTRSTLDRNLLATLNAPKVGLLPQLQSTLARIDTRVRSASGVGKLGRVIRMLKWPLRKGGVASDVAQIARLRGQISLAFQISIG
jgi:hypothetical protein